MRWHVHVRAHSRQRRRFGKQSFRQNKVTSIASWYIISSSWASITAAINFSAEEPARYLISHLLVMYTIAATPPPNTQTQTQLTEQLFPCVPQRFQHELQTVAWLDIPSDVGKDSFVHHSRDVHMPYCRQHVFHHSPMMSRVQNNRVGGKVRKGRGWGRVGCHTSISKQKNSK